MSVLRDDRQSAPAAAPHKAPRIPDITAISGTPAAGAMLPEPPRPFIIRLGKALRGTFDRVIAACSLVPTTPLLDSRDFAWTETLRDHWRAIRDEAVKVAMVGDNAPPLAAISPDHRGIAEVNKWKSFFLYGYGYAIEENVARCPVTARLVAAIPGLNTAFFSILEPGTHIPDHRGVTKGLLTCHLALVVPAHGDVRMRVADQTVRWREGEVVVFDDSYRHEVWNDSTGTRVVLLLQVRRPLRQPGRLVAGFFLAFVRRSAFVQEARDNLRSWNDALRQLDG